MSRLAQRRRALRRWRYRQRYTHLTLPRGDWHGWPSSVREVYGHSPEYPRLRGWIFNAWQFDPNLTNTPYWWVPQFAELHGIRRGDWVLRRVGDAGLFAVLSPAHFDRWQSYDPQAARAVPLG